MQDALANALHLLGVPPEAFVSFEASPTARHLKYMDLLHPTDGAAGPGGETLPDGVVEISGKAAVYVIRSPLLATRTTTPELAQLMRTLACRADATYLAFLEPGVTTVYRVGFYGEGVLPVVDAVIEPTNAVGLRNLLCGHDSASGQAAVDLLWLDDLLFKLLTESATSLQEACVSAQLQDGTVLSLIGRALFTRFLVDREIVRELDIGTISSSAQRPEQLFSNVDTLIETFEWLDRTFNGDLLELGTKDYRALMESLGPAAVTTCAILSNIMSRSSGGQLSLAWDGLRFQHIPVDVLSQVYEHFAHRFTPDTARETSIHYTPRGIAELLVDGVFSATPEHQRYVARVLDPAVGAGVFLVLTFRRLIAERWLHSGIRPKRAEIRSVLTTQLCGMDINPTSIKVAALSLYLAALELDPEPQPLTDLRFERLFDSTLRCVDTIHLGEVDDSDLGSLSKQLRTLGPFDIVLGNPPWTRLPGAYKKLLDETAWREGETPPPGAKSLVPNVWPDIAFLWRSTEWCKPGGVIGMLVHARVLFSEEAAAVRTRWFSITRVTGILNGMLLRKERKIWPSNSQPFCAIVAINEPANPEDSFYFLTPRNEPTLGQRREFRLDPRSAIPVPMAAAIHQLHAFKTLARGSALDLDLVARLRRRPRIAMREYLDQNHLEMNQGFIAGSGDFQDAAILKELPILEGPDKPLFAVVTTEIDRLKDRYPDALIHRPRDSDIYTGPHLLFREAPKKNPAERGAVYTDGDVAFSRSFYGITIPNHLTNFAEYLYILSYTDLLIYWALMTSSKFGVEREVFNVADFLNFPIPRLDTLSRAMQKEISELASKIRGGHQPWDQLNAFAGRIYGLTTYDLALVADALHYESPYPSSQAAGLRLVPRSGDLVASFAIELAGIISESEGLDLEGGAVELNHDDGAWQFVRISKPTCLDFDQNGAAALLRRVTEPLMSSEVRIQLGPHDWLIGRLRHERYWSRSQARLLALDLVERELFSDARN